jgi:environmental stress-induced protein Ves
MRILHLTQKDYKTSAWSGGTTTELFIWPQGADYARREFAFRISSAVVELEESDFTPLMGVERWITPLAGGFTLTHPGKAPVTMGPLAEPYRFSGEEATHCVGQATDFNLMLKGVEGQMALCCDSAPVKPGFNCYYAHTATGVWLDREYALAAGDVLVIFSGETAAVKLKNAPVLACHVTI